MNDDVKAANEALVESMVRQLRGCVSVGDEMTLDHACLIDDAADWIASEPDRIAAAREEQREACAKDAEERVGCVSTFDEIRGVPLTATPQADRIAELEAEVARRDALIRTDGYEDMRQHAQQLAARIAELEAERDEAVVTLRARIAELERAKKTLDAVCVVLGREVGNRGDSEGAVDVAERIIRERDEAVAALRALLPEVYGPRSPPTVGYAIDRHRIIAQARAVLAKYPEGER